MQGKLKDLTINRDGTQNVTIAVTSDFREAFDELSKYDVSVEIKKLSKRRSLDANAMAWVLIDKIAEKTHLKKSEVYRNAIREIGGVSTVVCVKNEAVDALCYGWSDHGMGWQTEKVPSKIPDCTNVTLWYGSSVYNTEQMSALIDSLIQDAEALGIPTMSEQETQKLIEMWGFKYEQKKAKNQN